MLHYNFPPFSVGEVENVARTQPPRHRARQSCRAGHYSGAASRCRFSLYHPHRFRSDGVQRLFVHGYRVRGIPFPSWTAACPSRLPVAGIALGLIKEGDKVAVLSDILGDEDHIGDMDFKVAGTREGVTAFQMDVKISGITSEIMKKALYQANEGRLLILDKMEEAINEPRPDISPYAPRIQTIQIPLDKIRDVIGPGGKTIRGIVEETGAKIDIDDSGEVNIASANAEALKKAIDIVRNLTQRAEAGEIYLGKVKRIMDFGAFVEILPGTEGLVHISQLENSRVEKVTDVLNEGDEVMVKVLNIDRSGKIRLSRKEALGHVPEDHA